MDILNAILTEATCSEACWSAKEDVCRCSCGGKNHGCLRSKDGVQPNRTSKLDGYRYELRGVGGDVMKAAHEINKAAGHNFMYISTSRDKWARNIPAKVRAATKSQIEKWPELQSERERISTLKAWQNRTVYLLWVQVPATTEGN